ncbi:unnamed protein product [Nyctereutes procyonoides]|uniref:(raccoon dog) hypothetical protein n=1 Tax=Nyctereutes procyonoides TaxID=34880 RepID=A0A811Y2E8_NYCPR|nr:unnamed protein product [Nyctereutes procyonoides]CAD7666899.1 unnamed protein product [Nyctereutes procyonoides]CAD7670928.1 unnamed protein product [Nyctereutes procyonoides]CAD7685932.1 unnamed protein product [Nyctereutes procyonoides]
MDDVNQSVVSEFIFHGLCDSRELQTFLLLPSSMLYLMTVVGNLIVVILFITDPHLHSQMYFLANLSFVDFCLTSVTTPKLTTDFLKHHKTISFGRCTSQILCVHLFAGIEMVLLVTVAHDCYMAICKPLHYSSIMDRQKYIWLVLISCIIGFICPSVDPEEWVTVFFCDIPLVSKLACMDTHTLKMLINSDSGVLATTCFLLLLASYTYILVTVLMLLFFVPCMFIYLWPLSITWVDKLLAVFYTVITPLLNPAICTLRNKEIRNAIKRLISRLTNP